MSKGRKIALGIIIALVLIVAVLAIALPMLVDVDRYRPQVAARIEEETGKPAQIGRLSLTVFPTVAIRVDDFKLGNPRAFPPGDLVDVRQISAVVDAGALWNRQVIIKSLELDDPTIHLLSDGHGHWNFESAPKTPAVKPASATDKPLFTLGVIAEVIVKGAHVTVSDALSATEAGPAYFEATGFSSQLQQVDLNAFAASASAGMQRLPLLAREATIGSVITDFMGASVLYAATPSHPAAEGTLRADVLRFQKIEATSLKSKLRLFTKQVFLDDLNIDFCGGRAVGNLSLDFGGPNLRYATRARLSGVDMAKLLEAFPEERGKMTGKMDGNADINGEVVHTGGPLAGVRGTGQATIRNGQLPSLQLNRNLLMLARLTNLGPASGDPSSFSSLAADFNIAEEKITSHKVALAGNGVDVDGAGTVGVAGAGSLDYQGVASIAAAQNVVSSLLAGLTGAKQEGGKLKFPFALSGTLESPKFSLQSGGGPLGLQFGKPGQSGTGSQTQQPADLVKGLTDLFKKKKETSPQQPPPQ